MHPRSRDRNAGPGQDRTTGGAELDASESPDAGQDGDPTKAPATKAPTRTATLFDLDDALARALVCQSPHPLLLLGQTGEVLWENETATATRERFGLQERERLLPSGHAEALRHCLAGATVELRLEIASTFSADEKVVISWEYRHLPEKGLIALFGMDLTAESIVRRKLERDALHDSLTGLPNRTLLADRLDRLAERAERVPNYRFAVLCMGLDRFKVLNEGMGHAMGDHVLKGIARRLEGRLRPGDTVSRTGGDEFAILLDGISDPSEAVEFASLIHESVREPFDLGGHPFATTASIGIALSEPGGDPGSDLLRDAGTAMARAKSLGKARCVVFEAGMQDRAVALLHLEKDLRRSIDQQEFQVWYQPIVSLTTLRLSGFEALVRWNHPDRGVVQPSEFIPLSEETELILPIGLWVLREACRQQRAWQERIALAESFSVSVNLSGVQFVQTDFADRVESMLAEEGVDPGAIKLEITESSMMANGEAARRTLVRLRQMGIKLCLDDFGTGYSSLSHLHQYPFDTLKIDRSFVGRMGGENGIGGGEAPEIVRTIVSLAQALDMDVVAEGIETQIHLVRLRALGCDYGQGFFFAHPLPEEKATALLERMAETAPHPLSASTWRQFA